MRSKDAEVDGNDGVLVVDGGGGCPVTPFCSWSSAARVLVLEGDRREDKTSGGRVPN